MQIQILDFTKEKDFIVAVSIGKFIGNRTSAPGIQLDSAGNCKWRFEEDNDYIHQNPLPIATKLFNSRIQNHPDCPSSPVLSSLKEQSGNQWKQVWNLNKDKLDKSVITTSR